MSGVNDHSEIARRLFDVGIRFLQVREKEIPDSDLLAAVDRVAAMGRQQGARVLVNDRADIAHLAGVGVHLGDEDLPAPAARLLLADESLVGVSTHDPDAAARAFADPACDYVAFGPVFESATKRGRPPCGTAALAGVARTRTKPLVAVGGITADNLDAVLDAGADSAAMVAGLLSEGRLEENTRRVLDRARRRAPAGRIYLVGFMGSGKTAVGRSVAERLGVPFVDLDAEIERTSGMTIRALFESSGEAAFRERESLFLAGTEALPHAVVATGGGCYALEENRRTIARLGRAVFLDVPFPRILQRLSRKTDRPLFTGPEQAARLHSEREPFYRMAGLRVSLSDHSIEQAADRVLAALDARDGGVTPA